MKIRLFLFYFFPMVEIVKCWYYESAFDLELYKSVLNADLCHKHIQFLHSSPHLLQKFMEANANIPHDLSAKGVLTYTGDYFNCLSIQDHVNGLNIQGKYLQVTVDVPGHINNYEYEEIDNVTWQEIRNNFDRRQSIKVTYEIGCKVLPPPDPEYWKRRYETNTITLGVCIPEPCSAAQAVDFVLDTQNRPLTLEGKVLQPNYTIQFYRLPSDKPISSADYVFMATLSLFVLFAITGTINDITGVDNLVSDQVIVISRCFAVHKNIQQLLKVDSSSNTIQCVDGIRAIAMAMILWLHCYNGSGTYLSSGWSTNFFLPLFTYGVDTFLLLGGIFSVFSSIYKYKKRSLLRNLHLHVLNRLVRIYPVLCFAVLAQASIMNHVGDGPQWYQMASRVTSCRLSWWSNLLFVQNIISVCPLGQPGLGTIISVNTSTIGKTWCGDKGLTMALGGGYGNHQWTTAIPTSLCLGNTWYLSMDMQLFLVSTLVLMWMFGKKRTAWTALVVAVILSLACSTIFSFLFNFQISLFNDDIYHPEYEEKHFIQYKSTLCRSPPYFVGMIMGYILINLNQQQDTFHFSKVWIWFLWIFAIFILTLSVFGMSIIWDFINNQVLHNLMKANITAVWSLAVSWVIIACHLGYGGPVNWFLSLKQWKLLSRLSYTMYVLHVPILVWMVSAQSDDAIILKTVHLKLFQQFLALFFASAIVAFIVTVLIEQPVLNLYKLLLREKKPIANIKTKVGYEEKVSCDAVSTLNVSIQEGK